MNNSRRGLLLVDADAGANETRRVVAGGCDGGGRGRRRSGCVIHCVTAERRRSRRRKLRGGSEAGDGATTGRETERAVFFCGFRIRARTHVYLCAG